MDIHQAIKERKSVRRYKIDPIEGEVLEELLKEIEECNKESGLNMQLVLNKPDVFDNFFARYGKFKGVENYVALVGDKNKITAEKVGYYGERIVLKAQMLGLNTCWLALSYDKKRGKSYIEIPKGKKLYCVISIGYGTYKGVARKSKSFKELSKTEGEVPEWFVKGVESAMLAPTAVNQQKFRLELVGEKVKAVKLLGPYSDIDLGIVKYHFEVGSQKSSDIWL